VQEPGQSNYRVPEATDVAGRSSFPKSIVGENRCEIQAAPAQSMQMNEENGSNSQLYRKSVELGVARLPCESR